MFKRAKRAAFTLIEMIMVIVILGIVSMIGTDIIARMYQGYIHAQIINELQQKTELAIDQITKRLQYRIKPTAIAKNFTTPTILKKLANDESTQTYNVLEWIGYDNEGFLGEWNGTAYTPGWSGFIDLNDTVTNVAQVSTKGSRLDFAERTISALSYGDINMASGAEFPALIFKKIENAEPRTFGLDPNFPTDHNNTFRVERNAGNTNVLLFEEATVAAAPKRLYEQYYLAWSAYAIVPENTTSTDDFNLTLHYNYQPWHGETFKDGITEKITIAEHVSTFAFTQTGNTIRIKLCIQDGNRTGTPIAFCKEKAIF